MIKTAIGLILLLSPFLLTTKFANKKIGFSYVVAFSMAFQLSVGILTQALHIFTYPLILALNLAMVLAILFKAKIRAKTIKTNFKELFLRSKGLKQCMGKIDWILVFVAVILFIQFFSVHYNYSGKYTVLTTSDYKQAQNMVYPYPYFSDEWYAISLIKYSINSHSLPLANPLMHNVPFVNLEFPFHSFLAEMMLLLDLDPLTQYTQLTIFSGMIICILVYLFLRFNDVGRMPAAIACLSVSYIIDGANLPGLWTLTPLMVGTISLLLAFFFISAGDRRMMFFMSIPTLLFYPPLFVFYAVAVVAFFVKSKGMSNPERLRHISKYLALAAFAAVVLAVSYFMAKSSFRDFVPYIASKIFHPTFIPNAIRSVPLYVAVPIPILLLSAFGVFSVIKKKAWLVSMLFLGLVYWIFYSYVTFRFIIEFQRVVIFTSVLITILAGFGLGGLINLLRRRSIFQRTYKRINILDYAMAGILVSLFLLSFSYTVRDDWKQITLHIFGTNQTFLPAAPANMILQPDDLRLFENIKSQTFLAPPWKGTVIGVATDNYPITTKAGTITNYRTAFLEFASLDCDGRYQFAKYKAVEYVYSPEFDCPGFGLIGSSSEGLYLYRVIA